MLLDLDVQLGLTRSLKQRVSDWEKAGGMNAQGLAFHARVRRSYLEQADAQGWAVLDATQSAVELSNEIWRRVEPEVNTRTLRAAKAVQTPLPLAGTVVGGAAKLTGAPTVTPPPGTDLTGPPDILGEATTPEPPTDQAGPS